MEKGLLYSLALQMTEGVGHITARKLIAYCGSPEAIFHETANSLSKVPGIPTRVIKELKNSLPLHKAEQEIKFIDEHNIQVTLLQDPHYPYLLKECPDAPIVLFSKGQVNYNSGYFLSIVGTRKPSEYNKQQIALIIKELSEKVPRLTIVSGLAYGVDICAHREALRYDIPTVGVMATSIDNIYPPTHTQISTEMIERGGLLTEYPSSNKLLKSNFIQRNRVIAGLSHATLVAESPAKGGSLTTAYLAQSYSRDVMAIPGRANNKYTQGCNNLIKRNVACLVENATDIIEQMNWQVKEPTLFPVEDIEKERHKLDKDSATIIEVLHRFDASIEEIVQETLLPLPKVSATLLSLEMKNIVKILPGGQYQALKY